MPTIEDWHDLQKRRAAAPEAVAARHQIRAEFHRAALDAEQVTGIEQWDTFSTYVNGLVALYQRQNDQFRRAIERTDAEDAEVLRINREIVHNRIRIETLLAVIRFPMEVKDRMAQLEKEMADGRE